MYTLLVKKSLTNVEVDDNDFYCIAWLGRYPSTRLTINLTSFYQENYLLLILLDEFRVYLLTLWFFVCQKTFRKWWKICQRPCSWCAHIFICCIVVAYRTKKNINPDRMIVYYYRRMANISKCQRICAVIRFILPAALVAFVVHVYYILWQISDCKRV